MPLRQVAPSSDYRVLVSRGWTRPRAELYPFSVRDELPTFSLPLAEGESAPEVGLNDIFQRLYDRVHFELVVDYDQPPVPPLLDVDAAWARDLRASS